MNVVGQKSTWPDVGFHLPYANYQALLVTLTSDSSVIFFPTTYPPAFTVKSLLGDSPPNLCLNLAFISNLLSQISLLPIFHGSPQLLHLLDGGLGDSVLPRESVEFLHRDGDHLGLGEPELVVERSDDLKIQFCFFHEKGCSTYQAHNGNLLIVC